MLWQSVCEQNGSKVYQSKEQDNRLKTVLQRERNTEARLQLLSQMVEFYMIFSCILFIKKTIKKKLLTFLMQMSKH